MVVSRPGTQYGLVMTLILFLIGLVLFDVLAMRFGVDSRDEFAETNLD